MIKESAIKIGPEIFTGKRHCDCYRAIEKKYTLEQYQKLIKKYNGDVQGFVTDTGVFLTRRQAAKYAFACGQIKKRTITLFSEDLY